MKKALYPGSFDPVTHGHVDVIRRAVKIFDGLILAVANNPTKKPLFSLDERVEMIKSVTSNIEGIEIDTFDGLLVDFVAHKKASVVVRGLRSMSDFEYEFQMALTNRKLSEEIETIFLMSGEQYSYMSSRAIKEIAELGGDVSKFVPAEVAEKLLAKIR
ncbi:MAG: pantetheine-phosphate adenylyltransferase [Candidatus Ancaeobacter aquaticus]|nr:pantetheine-phosphate adenylyltransferase [Candidatus Ancaeobacter aquaticus]